MRAVRDNNEQDASTIKQGLRQQEFNAREVRDLIRNNEYGGTTSGLASGFVQANLGILPGE